MYAKSLVDDMHNVYSLFGPDCITFLSNDDKARIALGLPIAQLQSPILMHMDYKVEGAIREVQSFDESLLVPTDKI